MITVILVIHLLIAISLVVIVLLQPSEGGGLGLGSAGGGGSGAGLSGFLSGRGTANMLTRTTAVLAACFMATSIFLTILADGDRAPRSILDDFEQIPAGEQDFQPTDEPVSPEVPVQ